MTEVVVRRCSVKQVFLEISQNSQENTCARVSFLTKKPLVQVFSCKFCEISKDTFFTEHLRWQIPIDLTFLNSYSRALSQIGFR